MPAIATHVPRLKLLRGSFLLRLLPHGLSLFAAGLLLLGAYRGYQWIWSHDLPPAAPSTVATTDASPDPLQDLLAANLFGSLEGESSSAPPLSSLKIIVNGVVAAAERSLALVSIEGKPQDSFAVGEEILPGVQLAEVQADRIFVKRGNLLEMLMLEGANDLPLLSMLVGASPPAASAQANGASRRDQTEVTLSRTMLQNKVQSPQELLSQVTLVKDGKAGFQLREIESGSLVEELGLRGGDTIVGINGLAINSTDDMMHAYQTVKSANLVRLEIVRAGNKQMLEYKIN